MTQLTKPDQIWVLKPTEADLRAGASYAATTLPWTFDRMMLNTSSGGQQSRALNIAKGIVGQEILRRALVRRGIAQEVERKSYRDDDMFDFRLSVNGVDTKLDVKSIHHYTNYAGVAKEQLSPELIIANADYPGPDWRRFFPMLVPHTQIGQGKEAYCFAIASSIDIRRDIDTNRTAYALTAFPFGRIMAFLSSSKLCKARESAGQGFFVTCSYSSDALLDTDALRLKLIGESDGDPKIVEIDLRKGVPATNVGPFSCLSSFQLERSDYDRLYGRITITVSRNDFTQPVLNTARQNINVPPDETLVLSSSDFCNLMLPTDYTVYFIGWLTKEEFLRKCRSYTGWVWPKDSVNKYENQPWSQITEKDMTSISRAGFEDCIQGRPRLVRAGWMKTNGRGGGACCYVFPNIGMNGGVKETNLYVLPKDLHIMDDLR